MEGEEGTAGVHWDVMAGAATQLTPDKQINKKMQTKPRAGNSGYIDCWLWAVTCPCPCSDQL